MTIKSGISPKPQIAHAEEQPDSRKVEPPTEFTRTQANRKVIRTTWVENENFAMQVHAKLRMNS